MFRKAANKLLGRTVFKIPKRPLKGLFGYTGWHHCKYSTYLNGRTKTKDIDMILRSISYGSERDGRDWNVDPRKCFFYRNKKPTLSTSLCKKIIKNIPDKDFIDRTIDYLYDYAILFDKNNNPLNYEQYPAIYKAGSYILCFPILYMSEPLTKKQLKSMCSMVDKIVIIVSEKDSIKIIKFGKLNDDPVTYKYPKDREGLIRALLTIALKDKEIAKLKDIDVSALIKVVF